MWACATRVGQHEGQGARLIDKRRRPTTDAVWQDLRTRFPVGPILSHYCGVGHRSIALDDTPITHAALPGVQIEVLDSPGIRTIHKVLIHINNTNPILVEGGPGRRALSEHGIEVASDGMTFEL